MEDLDRDEEAGEQEQDAQELAELEPFGIPNRLSVSPSVATIAPMAIRIVAGTRLWSRPARSARDGAGQRGHEVDQDRDRRDEQVEQELVAGLVRIQRVGQHPPLGHEHVGREDGAQDQGEGAGDVEERGQQSELRREERRRPARPWPGRPRSPAPAASSSPSGRGSGRVAPTTAEAASAASARWEIRLDGDGQGQQPGRDEVEQRQRAGARILRPVADQEREQAGQEQAQREACSRNASGPAGTPFRAPASRRSRPRRSGTRSGTGASFQPPARRSPRRPAPTP